MLEEPSAVLYLRELGWTLTRNWTGAYITRNPKDNDWDGCYVLKGVEQIAKRFGWKKAKAVHVGWK